MKKAISALLVFTVFFNICKAQNSVKLDDFGRIVLNAYVSDKAKLPQEAKEQLLLKLEQIVTNYGMAGSASNERFLITAKVALTTKDVIAGPPQMIAQNIDITLFIGDGIENKVFTSKVISAKGVGINENKAFIDAIKKVNTKNKDIEAFITEGKNEILAYYNTQCDFILKNAEVLKQQQKYAEAIYTLVQVPQVCESCFNKCMNKLPELYNLKINTDADMAFSEAQSIWSATPDNDGAKKATDLIMQINPKAKVFGEAKTLLKQINEKVIADEKERLRKQEEYEKRQQEIDAENAKQQAEITKERINAYRQIAVEYVKNQPQVIYRNVYRNIYWY